MLLNMTVLFDLSISFDVIALSDMNLSLDMTGTVCSVVFEYVAGLRCIIGNDCFVGLNWVV